MDKPILPEPARLVTNETMQAALSTLECAFPGEPLYEVRVEFMFGHRSDGPEPETWRRAHWSLQITNEHEGGDTVAEALEKLRSRRALKAEAPGRAERVAAILREVPDVAFAREEVVMAARNLLDQERRSGHTR